tara:strand:+ start:20968 stop:21648 length:681 start_codon:yes stop_codon:yes gene_type:complete
MKQNLTLMLTFLLLLVGFFASTTYTGAFLRESITSRHIGGIENPDIYRAKAGGQLTKFPSFGIASESRKRDIMNTPGFWDGRLKPDVGFCRDLELKFATLQKYSVRVFIKNRFNKPQATFPTSMDINQDGVLTYADVLGCRASLGRNQDSERENQVQRWDCLQEGDSTCKLNRVHYCMPDPESGFLNWVRQDLPKDVDLAYTNCLPPRDDLPARYSGTKPILPFYK